VVFDRGSIATAVRASCSIPGIFHPVEYQGYVLVDGGVVTPLPCDVARQKGADIVIAVDIGSDPEISEAGNMVDVMLQSIDIMNRENAKCKQKMADIVIRPVIKGIGLMDFSQKKELIDAGREAARAKIDEIRFLLM
jgi:NTE family protein